MAWKIAELYAEIRADDTKFRAAMGRTESALRRVNAGMERMARVARRAFLIGGAAVGGMVRELMKFEQQMAMVSTMLSGQAMNWMPKYRKALSDMSVEFGESTATLTKGMYDLLSAGVAPAQALRTLEIAVQSAKGGFTDTATVVKGTTALLNAYGLSAKYAGAVTDMMAMTVSKGVINMTQLASTIGKAAPMARAAGMSMQVLLAAVAGLTKQGISAEEAMTAVRTTLAYAAKEGMSFLQVIEKFRGRQLAEILGAGVPQESARGIAALSGSYGELRTTIDAMYRSAGKRLEDFEKAQKSSMYQWNQAKQAILAAARTLGTAFAPMVKDVAKWIMELADKIRSLSEEDLKKLGERAKLVGIILVGVWAAPKLVMAMKGIIILAKGMIVAFTGVAMAATAMGLALSVGVGVLGLLAAGFGYAAIKCAQLRAEQEKLEAASMDAAGTEKKLLALRTEAKTLTGEALLANIRKQIALHRERIEVQEGEMHETPATRLQVKRRREIVAALEKRLPAGGAAGAPAAAAGVPAAVTPPAQKAGAAFMGLADFWKYISTAGAADPAMRIQQAQLVELKRFNRFLEQGRGIALVVGD